MSINQTAKTGILSEHTLRKMVKSGECPYIKSGRKVLINYGALIEMLEEKSRSEHNKEVW